jgi:VWFA-related protein
MKRFVAVLIALTALPSLAQTTPQTAPQAIPQQGEVINVQVTNLDVVVTDSKGKRVTGLTKDDFEVIEDGKPQTISNLSEIGRTANAVTETTQPAPRRILLIVDNGSIALSARRKVFNATRAALERLLIGPSDRLAIATVSRSLQQRLGWTADKAEVLSVLTTIEKDAILPHPDLLAFERMIEGLSDDADKAATTMGPPRDRDGNEIRDVTTGASSGNSMAGVRSSPPIDFQQVIAAGRNYSGSATNQTKQTISSLSGAINAFAEVPGGRKIVILVGGGLPLNAAESVFQRIETVRDQAELSGHRGFKGTRTASTLTQISSYDVTPLVDKLAAAARLKGVAFYAVNPEFGDKQGTSVTSRSGSDQMAEFAAMKGMLDGYNRLASATGGTAMIGRAADQVITEIVSDLESYYSLGYRASGPLNPKSQIVVKVKKGLTARATISSGAVSRDWEVSDQVLANLVAEPLNPLGFSVVMDPAIVEGDKKTIPMKIMIPVNSLKLVQDGGEYAASFAVFITMGDEGGNGSEPSRQEQSFRWPANAVAQVKGKTIGFAVSLEVGAGRDRVSVGVLDQYSGAAGFTRVMLQ